MEVAGTGEETIREWLSAVEVKICLGLSSAPRCRLGKTSQLQPVHGLTRLSAPAVGEWTAVLTKPIARRGKKAYRKGIVGKSAQYYEGSRPGRLLTEGFLAANISTPPRRA